MIKALTKKLTKGSAASGDGSAYDGKASDGKLGDPGATASPELNGRSSPVNPLPVMPALSHSSASAHHPVGDGDTVPRADVALPSAVKRERRRSSVMPGFLLDAPGTRAKLEFMSLVKDPLVHVTLKDAPSAKKELLFKQKVQLCSFTGIDWESSAKADVDARDTKKKALMDLVDSINTPLGAKLLSESMYGEVIQMVAVNIFRTFPPSAKSNNSGGEEVTGIPGGEEGDEEPSSDPAWNHLVYVYEFLLRFVMGADVKIKTAKKYIDNAFCGKLIDLFESEDPREREYLKTILHRIYGKFMSHRAFIRKAIRDVFLRFVFETEKHPGIGELLEILGSIVNGFALPLKQEHVVFLEKSLLPLFRPRTVKNYIQQLCYCVAQYIEKDAAMSVNVLQHLARFWPLSTSEKQIVLLGAVEEVLEMAGESAVPGLAAVSKILARTAGSSHFQVAERALFMWQNEKLSKSDGLLSVRFTRQVLPCMYPALVKNGSGHWNPHVEQLATFVMKHYQEADPTFFESVAAEYDATQAALEGGQGATASASKAMTAEDRAVRWKAIEEQYGALVGLRNTGAGAAQTTAGAGLAQGAGYSSSTGAGMVIAPSSSSLRDTG